MDTITTIQSLSASNGSAQPVMVALTQNELRLIAAAPDLLAALRGMLADYEDYFGRERPSVTASAARAAIARATTQGD